MEGDQVGFVPAAAAAFCLFVLLFFLELEYVVGKCSSTELCVPSLSPGSFK